MRLFMMLCAGSLWAWCIMNPTGLDACVFQESVRTEWRGDMCAAEHSHDTCKGLSWVTEWVPWSSSMEKPHRSHGSEVIYSLLLSVLSVPAWSSGPM